MPSRRVGNLVWLPLQPDFITRDELRIYWGESERRSGGGGRVHREERGSEEKHGAIDLWRKFKDASWGTLLRGIYIVTSCETAVNWRGRKSRRPCLVCTTCGVQLRLEVVWPWISWQMYGIPRRVLELDASLDWELSSKSRSDRQETMVNGVSVPDDEVPGGAVWIPLLLNRHRDEEWRTHGCRRGKGIVEYCQRIRNWYQAVLLMMKCNQTQNCAAIDA